MKTRTTSSRGATMRDVAEKAGVSIMTVSLALRGGEDSGRLAVETRSRVRAAANELGYIHNARARALRLGKTNVVGLYAGHGYINVRIPFYNEVVSGMQEGCEQVHRDLLLHGVFHATSEGDIVRELADGRIDGLIVAVPFASGFLATLRESGFPVVSIVDPQPGIPSVGVDDTDGARKIATHLHSLGHRKTVYVSSPDRQIASAEKRLESYVATANALGLEATVVRPHDDRHGQDLARTAIDAGATALACWNDLSAFGILAQCAAAGIRVPDDLSVVGFDGVPLPYGLPLELTTVVAPWAEVAKLAVLRLDAILNGEEVPLLTTLPVQLSPGSTTKAIS